MTTAGKKRRFVLPSGKEISLLGYEAGVLDELLLQGMKESDFDFSQTSLPPIFYEDTSGKSHRYYPDFYVPRMNWIIEVKSEYIYQLEKEENLLKRHRCKELGYAFNLILRRSRKKLVLLQELRPQNDK
jgi:hypothetical protein